MPAVEPIVPRLFPPARIVAGFTTRAGGVSTGPHTSLNMGGSTADDPATVAENRRRLARWAGVEATRFALMEQVHGAKVEVARAGACHHATDGLVVTEPGVLAGVLVADCVPLILYDPSTHTAAVVHCGWRSIVAGIAEEAIRLMGAECGSEPASILAALGPAAGVCCYEVGRDAADNLRPSSLTARDGKQYADLRGELTQHLAEAGLAPGNIEASRDCTICTDRFFSHRRDHGVTGRMMGFAALKDIGHSPSSGRFDIIHQPTYHEESL